MKTDKNEIGSELKGTPLPGFMRSNINVLIFCLDLMIFHTSIVTPYVSLIWGHNFLPHGESKSTEKTAGIHKFCCLKD